MAKIFQNLRIGTKLAASGALSVLLIGGMIYSQIIGNSAITEANKNANDQQTIVRDAIDAKASIRGMQTGARDVRLASVPADLQKATDYIAARLKSVNGFTKEMLRLAHFPETHERIARIDNLAADYAKAIQQIAANRRERIDTDKKRSGQDKLPAEASAQSI